MKKALFKSSLTIAALLVFFNFQMTAAHAQGSLTPPPGGPAPSMKSLDQIASTGIAINAINTPGNGSNQFIINHQGSYFLTDNVFGASGKNGILLTSGNVTIDLNGFMLQGGSGTLAGITDGGINQGNTIIRNGTIFVWGGAGITLSNSFNSLIENIISADNVGPGMSVGDAATVRDCVCRDNVGDGFATGFNANLTHCTSVGSSSGNGFNMASDCILEGCVANFNKQKGILVNVTCTISHCSANQNAGGGIQIGADSVVESCTANSNIGIGMSLGDGTIANNCTARVSSADNFLTGFNANLNHCVAVGSANGSGINLGQDGTLTGCTGDFNKFSGITTAAGCTVSTCTANQNSSVGILLGVHGSLTDCTSYNNADGGINCLAGCTVTHCTANLNSGVFDTAFLLATGCTMSDCTASYNTTQFGIGANAGCTVSHCTASFNNASVPFSSGFSIFGATMTECTALNNTSSLTGNTNGMGILCNSSDATIKLCNAAGNKGDNIYVVGRSLILENHASLGAAGIHITGSDNRVEGNQVVGNAVGIQVDSTVNLVFRNTARANTTNFSIVAGNHVATIVSPANNTAISGNSGGTAFSTDAFANVVY